MTQFIGREEELTLLKALFHKASASLIVVRGRRRIGKSRLLAEFGKSFDRTITFSGLPPQSKKKITAKMQRIEFIKQLSYQELDSNVKPDDWSDVFWHLAKQIPNGRTLIILDEISWMGSPDPNFLGKLKNAWDMFFSKHDKLILALCGSAAAWIDKNILSSTGFLGRESLSLKLEELPLTSCVKFWGDTHHHISAYEKLKVLAVTGGIPRYLEHINPQITAEENIQRLCFQKSGILYSEFEKIFADLFVDKNKLYRDILEVVANGIADQDKIAQQIAKERNGMLSECLHDLIESGFLSRDYTWNIKTESASNLSHYRLKDNYSRFYLKYIHPNKNKILSSSIQQIHLSSFKNWSTVMALQVENLILSNRELIISALNIALSDIISENPFFQKKNNRQHGCQIDYLIQTRFDTLYLCEIKYSRHPIGLEIIQEMKTKIDHLSKPRNFSCRPVLIHVNGVTDSLIDSQYFSHIIDFSKFVE